MFSSLSLTHTYNTDNQTNEFCWICVGIGCYVGTMGGIIWGECRFWGNNLGLLMSAKFFYSHFKGWISDGKNRPLLLVHPLSAVVWRWRKCPQQSTISWKGDMVDFFKSHLEMNGDIKMHKFPASNLNKNANETLWVLIMQRTRFLLFVKESFQEKVLNWQRNLFWCIRIYDTTYSLDISKIKTPSN